MGANGSSRAATEDHSEDRQLIEQLRDFRPRPGPRFYRRMEASPWTRAPESARGGWFGLRTGRLALGAAMLLLAVVALLALSPAGRATAERLARFFFFNGRERTTITVTVPAPGRLEPDFSLSPEEAGARAGFEVRTPVELPPSLALTGSAYLPESGEVILSYETADGGTVLRITQRPTADAQAYAGVASSARVERVLVNGQDGEYVAGGWQAEIREEDLEKVLPLAPVSLEADWRPGTYIQVLRWAEGRIQYEILAVGAEGNVLDKAALLGIAEGLQ